MKLKGDEKILLIDCRRIGDTLMSFPTLELLKKEYPNIKTGIVIEKIASGLTDNLDFIDKTYVFNAKGGLRGVFSLIWQIKKAKYDIVIDALGMPKSAIMAFLTGIKVRVSIHQKRKIFYTHLYTDKLRRGYSAHQKIDVLKVLGIDTDQKKLPFPKIVLSDEEERDMQQFINKNNLGEFFTSSPGSKLEYTLWTPKKWAEVYDWIVERYNKKVVVLYAPSEKKFVDEIVKYINHKDEILTNIVFSDMRKLTAFISFSKFHLTQNNGSKHLANTQKIPCLTLWSCFTSYTNWTHPRGSSLIDEVVLADSFNHNMYKQDCKECMNLVTVESVKNKIKNIMEQIN